MSRIAFISDIHGNLTALDAVLEEIARLGVDEVVCLGDVVGYGPEPEECLERLVGKLSVCVRGNHEDALIEPAVAGSFNPIAKTAIEWTRKRMSPRHLGLIQSMRAVFDRSPFLVCVHDTPVPPSATGYVGDPDSAALAFRGIDARICLLGHTHIPMAFRTASERCEDRLVGGDVEANILHHGEPYGLAPTGRHILNPGSVGQPRDGDPRASFAVLDLHRGVFQVHRVAYDVTIAQRLMRRAGLPDLLAYRLALGA